MAKLGVNGASQWHNPVGMGKDTVQKQNQMGEHKDYENRRHDGY